MPGIATEFQSLDAPEEDLERPSRRWVLVGGVSTPLAAEDTQRESISIPHQSGVTFVDMTQTIQMRKTHIGVAHGLTGVPDDG